MAITDYALIGVAGLAAADTVLDITSTNTTKQPKAEWYPNASYESDVVAKKLTIFDKYYSKIENNNEKPLLSIERAYSDWNILKINGLEVPGKANISVNFSRDIERKKLPGYDYADVLDNGSNLKQISISILMNGVDYNNYLTTIQSILAVKYSSVNDQMYGLFNATPPLENVIFMENPLLLQYGISRVVMESISQSSPEIGLTEVRLECVEYIEKHKRPARPKKNTNVKTSQKTAPPLVVGDSKY
jgi:hypothetical protein